MTTQKMPDVIFAIEHEYYDDFYSDSFGRVWDYTQERQDGQATKYLRADLVSEMECQIRLLKELCDAKDGLIKELGEK